MSGHELSDALRAVADELNSRDEHTAATLAAALRRPLGIDDVARWIRFDPRGYVRNLVSEGKSWELRLLCWRPKQTTSVHSHGASACAFRVLRGSALETVLGSRDRMWAPGDVVEESRPNLVHQVGNAGDDAMLTLHAYSPRLPIDAPSSPSGDQVVIVGGGFSGVATAVHLLDGADPDLRITLVERGPWLGRGIAYGNDSEAFRLNVAASRMSIDPAKPDDFKIWAGAQDPQAFLPRVRFGEYVVQRLADAVHASRGKLRVVRGEAIAIDRDAVHLRDGTLLPARAVVVATGLSPRLAPSVLPADPRIIDAWDESGLATLPSRAHLLILGTGLTMLDLISFLDRHRFAGSALVMSRRGLIPRSHASHGSFKLSADAVESAPRDLRRLLAWGRDIVASVVRDGAPWQHGIDALRPHTSTLWRRLAPADRARFLRMVRPYWEVLRHRAPSDTLALFERLRTEGRLELAAGRVVACEPQADSLDVVVRHADGELRRGKFDAIVRCIGPALERSEVDAPLIRDLLARGEAVEDSAGLGIETDDEGRFIDATGRPSSRLFALGALRRASSWETTAVPDISRHAALIATIVKRGQSKTTDR